MDLILYAAAMNLESALLESYFEFLSEDLAS